MGACHSAKNKIEVQYDTIKTKKCWKPLSSTKHSMLQPININEDPFQFVIIQNNHSIHDRINVDFQPEFFKYNVSGDTFERLSKYPNYFASKHIYTASFNKSSDILYICSGKTHYHDYYNISFDIITYNIKMQKWNKIGDTVIETYYTTKHLYSEIIDNNFHIIVGYKHLIWNITDEYLKEHHLLPAPINNASMIYLKNTKRFLIIGGDENYNKQTRDCVYSYSPSYKINDCKLSIKLPKSMEFVGCAATLDERFVLLFHDYIYIMDTNNFLITKSDIKCPIQNGSFYACLVTNDFPSHDIDLLIHGFIKTLSMRYPSKDVIKLITSFYNISCNIHLFNRCDGRHWRIEMNQLFAIW